jgi:glutathione S-transferase
MELVHLHYSPWSERARWALEHHGIDYRSTRYTPMLGELGLRLRLGRFTGKVTVPVLFAGDQSVADSTDIARFSDRVGRGEPLMPNAHAAEILEWVERTDEALDAGRNLVTRRTGRSRAARLESLPAPLNRTGVLGDSMARSGVAFFVRKYGLETRREEEDAQALAKGLDALRAALGGRSTILSEFSFADIVATGLLQVVVPVSDRYLRLGPATRDVWKTDELSRSYADLVEWRDRLYERHRVRATNA